MRRADRPFQKVRFGYVRADGEATERTIWPLGLLFWGKVWTLAAWCELRVAYRNFRVDRIERLVVTEEAFPADAVAPTLADYMRRSE